MKDYYVSAVKGSIISQLPDVRIVDITHSITQFSILEASYVIKNAYSHFPKGAIHIIGVNGSETVNNPHIAVEHDGHFFIGADNGMFPMIFERKIPDKIVELNLKQDTDLLTFPTKDVFVKAACHIARGGTLEVIGKIKKEFNERTIFTPVVQEKLIRGMVIYIDVYHNLITNITQRMFKDTGKGREFIIHFRHYRINKISKGYSEVTEGEILALFNSAGYLEIATNSSNIGKLLKAQPQEGVNIEFS